MSFPDREYIECPSTILEPLLAITEDMHWGKGAIRNLSLYDCTPRTLCISEHVSAPLYSKMSAQHALTYRVERYLLIEHEKELALFDTIYAATLQGKGAGEVMLEMLAKSMEGV